MKRATGSWTWSPDKTAIWHEVGYNRSTPPRVTGDVRDN
jgi:hypothetical protein